MSTDLYSAPLSHLEYVTQQRKLSATMAQSGRPLRRMDAPAVIPPMGASSWWVAAGSRSVLRVVAVNQGKIRSFTFKEGDCGNVQEGMVENEGETLVFCDQNAANLYAASSANSRQLRARLVVPGFGSGAIILDAALANAFWMPDGIEQKGLAGWREAFHVKPGVQGTAALVSHVLSGSMAKEQSKFAKQISSQARQMVLGSGYRSAKSMIFGFRSATALSSLWDAYLNFDPIRVAESARTGSTVIGEVYHHGKWDLWQSMPKLKLTTPCRLKPSTSVAFLDFSSGDMVGVATVGELTFSDETGLSAAFVREAGTKKNSALTWLATASEGSRVYLSPMPFTSFNQNTEVAWTEHFEAPQVVRELPIDVALAAAES